MTEFAVRYDDTNVKVVEDYTTDSSPSTPPVVRTTKSIPNATENGVRKWKNTTFKARVEHDLTAQNLLYASISTGFSPGDVAISQDSNNQPYVFELDSETLTSYEIGSKNRFLDNRLQVNGAVYYYDYGGYQTAGVNANRSTVPGATPISVVMSSPAQVLGAELETIYQLTPNDRVGFNLGYTDAYYVNKAGAPFVVGTETLTFADYFARDKINQAVPYTASLSYDHSIALSGGSKLTLHGDARYMSGHDLTNVRPDQLASGSVQLPYIQVGGQVLGNLNATWASSSNTYSVTGYVRNVGDTRYKTSVNTLGSAYGTGLSDPLTYGVVLNARF